MVFHQLGIALALAGIVATVAPDTVAAENRDGVAIIIGNKGYGEKAPEVSFAHRDADVFGAYVRDILNFSEENIIDLRDASQAEMLAAFGSDRSHQGKLWSYLDPQGKSDVVVFYSGHGVPGIRDGRGYLLPSDADPNLAEINGYPLDLLYENLAKLETKSVAVFLDACFSGESPRGNLIKSASPGLMKSDLPVAGDGMTVLTAASGSQLASWDEEQEHGLFTGYLMKALYGAADGDDDGRVTAHETKDYLDREMTRTARRRFLRDQVASLSGDGGAVFAEAGHGGFPQRKAADAISGAELPNDGIMYVGSDFLNVRAGAGTIHDKIALLSPGTRVRVIQAVGDSGWLRILLSDGRTGFVFAQFLQPDPLAERPAPVVAAPPAGDGLYMPPILETPEPDIRDWYPVPSIRKPEKKARPGAGKPKPERRAPVRVGAIARVDYQRGGVVVALRSDLRSRPLKPHEKLLVRGQGGKMIRLKVIRMAQRKILAVPRGRLEDMDEGMGVFLTR